MFVILIINVKEFFHLDFSFKSYDFLKIFKFCLFLQKNHCFIEIFNAFSMQLKKSLYFFDDPVFISYPIFVILVSNESLTSPLSNAYLRFVLGLIVGSVDMTFANLPFVHISKQLT